MTTRTRLTLFLTQLWIVSLIGCTAAPTQVLQTATQAPGDAVGVYFPTTGWLTASPEEQGMDAQRLDQMLNKIREENLNLHSLLIIRNGYIVSETYFSNNRQDTPHELYSITKSFIATLVGIALDRGDIQRLDQRVLEIIPAETIENLDANKERMTIEHLLTMRPGLDWQEGDSAYRQMYMSSDWVRYVLDKPMIHPPGEVFNYCSGCSHVLSAVLQQVTGMNPLDFAKQALFEPLGISQIAWDLDADGIPIGGWGLHLTPRDMAKLGYLYLNDGMWDGKRIVSAEWVKAATQKHTDTDNILGYGYQWWIYPSYGAYAALGLYGQMVFVAPEANLIVVTTAGLDNHNEIFRLVEESILPAVQRP